MKPNKKPHMNKLGQSIKDLRISKEVSLRKFCIAIDQDPSNWSKVERGIIEAPKSDELLLKIKEVLGLSEDQYYELKGIAIVDSIPEQLKTEDSILAKLPVFFRTVRGSKPTDDELKNLIKILKED
jgi:transcriptional regulator with XRE-family HTH domain